MSFLRPAAQAALVRWSEVAAAGGLVAFGLWVLSAGGYVLGPLGLALTALGGVWGLIAWRRLRFLRPVGAPGVVEVDEGQISYFAPVFGGTLALADLDQVRLDAAGGRLHWRLRSTAGEALLIPVEAAGAERLYDAFSALAGIDMAALARAMAHGTGAGLVWEHPRARLGR